jgi:stringent starvation protein B
MSSPPRRLPPKKDVMIELLAKSGVFLHLDPRREGVVVPPQFRKQPELVLQVGLNMAVPIRDLEVDETGVSCTLSFNRSPFWCCMPWGSIFAIVSDEDRRGVVWPDDVPAESRLASAPAAAPKRPMLRAVGKDERAPPPPDEDRAGPEGEGSCRECGTRWVEDQDACPICGARRADAFVASGGTGEDDEDERETPARREPSLPLSIAAVPDAPPEPPPAAAAEPATARDEPPAEGEKPKRQLPPYLRIVK